MSRTAKAAAVAWLITALYYFYQYALRSAPAVMMPQLSEAFGLTAVGVASLVGVFYWGYSPFSLVAGVALDRFGPKRVIPMGAAAVGVGALLFGLGGTAAAGVGRFLQGAGGAFALVGAIYIVSTSFSAARAGTLIGATQMFGMAGGSAGQFLVGPLIGSGFPWSRFWVVMGCAGLVIGVVLALLLPGPQGVRADEGWVRAAAGALRTVFGNPQSILCGAIAGLLMMPTSIFDMVWGVRYLQEAREIDYATAVLRSATVPFGWIVGCPLLGFLSDHLGRRKPVIVAGASVLFLTLAWILYGRPGVFPPYVLGLVAGVASGATMIPYAVIKEANPPAVGGTATGVVNFLNFTLSALFGPVFGWLLRREAGEASSMRLEHYQVAFSPMLGGVALAILLTLLLRETGPAARRTA